MISIDGIIVEWDGRPVTIYQFLSQKGVIVPCFCYHEKLNIAGNCRMCLVEANGALVASCAMPLLPQMQIYTTSERLAHSRENVLEFLLVNHPLDCPICDQGGECDLQDISKTFGLDRGRFYETKRSVDNLNCFGSLVKTLMTRCIHCTRCVRFLAEYCDEWFLGIIGRGSSMEIGSFVSNVFIEDPLSANVIDLCPVGALTSMPYAFRARPWESKSIESIDIMDSLAGGLRFDVVQNKIVRCLPLITETLNEDWMTNKARFVYYSMQRQQEASPLLKISSKWTPISWRQAAILFFDLLFLNRKPLKARTGNFIDLETAALLKSFCFLSKGVKPTNEFIQEATAAYPQLYLFNSTLAQLEESTLVLLIGCNLRKENPLLYLRLRRSFLRKKTMALSLKVFSIGLGMEYENLPIIQLGSSVEALNLLMAGRLNGFKDFFFRGFKNLHTTDIFKALHQNPKMIVGPGIFHLKEAGEIQRRLWNFSQRWAELLEPSQESSTIYNAALDFLGKLSMFAVDCVSPIKGGADKKILQDHLYGPLPLVSELASIFSILHAADDPLAELPLTGKLCWNFMTESSGRTTEKDFVVYQGYTVPSSFASDVDLFLPTASPLERSSHFLNVLGLVRTSKIVLSPLKTTLTDPQILKFFYRFLFRYLQEKNLLEPQALSFLRKITTQFPWIDQFNEGFCAQYGIVLEHNSNFLAKVAPLYGTLLPTNHLPLTDCFIESSSANYYISDVFSQLSTVLVSCAAKCVPSNFAKRAPSSI